MHLYAQNNVYALYIGIRLMCALFLFNLQQEEHQQHFHI